MDEPLKPLAADLSRASNPPLKALAAWAIMILVLSMIPAPTYVPDKFIFLSFDTFAHAVFYMPLGALILWSFPRGPRITIWARAVAGTLAFGFMIELIQAFVPSRFFGWTDALADLTGGVIGATFALIFPRFYLFSFLQ